MEINKFPVKTLADTGCSKSCIKANLNFLKDFTTEKYNCKLLCANGDIVAANKTVLLPVKVGKILYNHSFVMVPNLSADAIIGIDLMKDLSFSRNNSFITINGETIPLYDDCIPEIGCSRLDVMLQPNTEVFVKVEIKL